MSEGGSTRAPGSELETLVTCVECGRSANGDEAQSWDYLATRPRAIHRLCPKCADLWHAAPVSEPDDFELSWLVPSVVACSICGAEIEIEEAQAARWGYWSHGAREFHPFCPGCAAREFGRH